GQALPAAHEVQQRLPARRGGGGVLRIVQELAGGAGQEDGVVLREVLLVDVGGVVGDGGGPRACLLAHLLDGPRGQRDRRVHVAGGPSEHEHAAGGARLRGRLVRQR